jgi:hypothetical protein
VVLGNRGAMDGEQVTTLRAAQASSQTPKSQAKCSTEEADQGSIRAIFLFLPLEKKWCGDNGMQNTVQV